MCTFVGAARSRCGWLLFRTRRCKCRTDGSQRPIKRVTCELLLADAGVEGAVAAAADSKYTGWMSTCPSPPSRWNTPTIRPAFSYISALCVSTMNCEERTHVVVVAAVAAAAALWPAPPDDDDDGGGGDDDADRTSKLARLLTLTLSRAESISSSR
jgi:hypothetical protein